MIIRQAQQSDAPAIHRLICGLAEYEKAAHEVKSTVADIERDGFGPNPLFHCLIAELDGDAVGFALYFFTWSTWTGTPSLYLEDLFVYPDKRGQGIGFGLLKACAQAALEKGCQRFEWAVLDWNHLARDFYHALGAYHKEEWLPYRLEGESLSKLAGS